MTQIFDQGVTPANYNPLAVGGVVWASMLYSNLRDDYGDTINIGDVVDGAHLLGGCLVTDGGTNTGNLRYHGAALPGTWKALGNVSKDSGFASDHHQYATIWLRVT